jgi:hypothetical protein
MKKTMLVCVCVVALAGSGFAVELLTNGDFEQPLDVGWTDTVVGSTGVAVFEHSDTLGQPVPGFAARVKKDLASYASLSQTVSVPDADLALSFDGRLSIGGGSSSCWPVAAFVVRYLDGTGVSLGNTKLYLHDQYCNWVDSDTQNLIDVNTPGVWTPFSLNISNELASNLPGVNAANVRQVTLEFFSFDNGT